MAGVYKFSGLEKEVEIMKPERVSEIEANVTRLQKEVVTYPLKDNLKKEIRSICEDYLASTEKLPPGAIVAFAGVESEIPDNWMPCDGRSLQVASYRSLYLLIGNKYGGEKDIYFNLPDLKGRFPLGKNDMDGKNSNRVKSKEAKQLGGFGGEEHHTLSVEEMPRHHHYKGTYKYLLQYTGKLTTYGTDDTIGEPDVAHKGEMVSRGGSQPHNNMPPYLTVNYIIKIK